MEKGKLLVKPNGEDVRCCIGRSSDEQARARVVHEGLHYHLEDHHRLAGAWGPKDKVRHAQVRAVEDVRHGLPLLGVQLGLQPRGACGRVRWHAAPASPGARHPREHEDRMLAGGEQIQLGDATPRLVPAIRGPR